MKGANAIIVHRSHLVAQGLKNVLHASHVVVKEILQELPVTSTMMGWKDCLWVIDVEFLEKIQPYFPQIKKNQNLIVVVAPDEKEPSPSLKFDEVILYSDNAQRIAQKLEGLLHQWKPKNKNNQLTEREVDILKLIARGDGNKQIADKLFISVHTVITHRKNITGKLGVKTIAGLTLYALINNLTD
jgi:DNA-binding CsgD family transcriptional regulator